MRCSITAILMNLSIPAMLLVAFSQLCFAHSARFPDYYKYDTSDEGAKIPTPSRTIAYDGTSDQQRPLATCENGLANNYPCHNIDLLGFIPATELSTDQQRLNDIWGWTNLATGAEITMVGLSASTVFVDITNPTAPSILGTLPSHNGGRGDWRDIKVYLDHAFIVADGPGNPSHGLQVFDLTQLQPSDTNQTFSATAHFSEFGPAHNIAINEDSGFAYVLGADVCGGGLYMIDISVPTAPSYAGCYAGDGYTHDAQCVTYQGPDTRFAGKEICVAFNEDTVTIVDVTDKTLPVQLARMPYDGASYTHQGWFLDDSHTHVIVNDELDESSLPSSRTRTYLFDLSLLDAPQSIGAYVGPTTAIDHNLYTKNGYVYESNYRAGLRILNADNIASGELAEVAYFDTIPCSNSAQFSGMWSSYIYFDSGNIVSSDIGTGLFVLRPNDAAIENESQAPAAQASPICAATQLPPPKRKKSSSTGMLLLFMLGLLALRRFCKLAL